MKFYPNGIGDNDNFCTPPSVYSQLNSIFNFTLDAACTSENCKAPKGFYFDKGMDALKESWGKERVFCNPPFNQKAKFIEKAYEEVVNKECPIVVMLLPLNCQSTVAFQKYIKKNFFYETLSGRLSFVSPYKDKADVGNTTGTTIVYFKKDIER